MDIGRPQPRRAGELLRRPMLKEPVWNQSWLYESREPRGNKDKNTFVLCS